MNKQEVQNSMLHTFLTMQFILFTISANVFIYRLQHIPILGKKIKGHWYSEQGIKSLFGALAIVQKIFFQFVKKTLYVLVFIILPIVVINNVCFDKELVTGEKEACFLYLFMFLNLLYGAFFNISSMNVDQNDYVMLKQMKVNPKTYYLGNMLVKIIGENIPFIVAFLIGSLILEVRVIRLLPLLLLLIGMRFFGEATALWVFKKYKVNYKSIDNKVFWAVSIVILPLAYGSLLLLHCAPMISNYLYSPVTWIVVLLAGLVGIYYVTTYDEYHKVANGLVKIEKFQGNDEMLKEIGEAGIGIKDGDIKKEDIHTNKYDHLKGYEYLHAIFFDRHKRLVRRKWKIKMICISVISVVALIFAFIFRNTDTVKDAVDTIDQALPVFLFVLYCICSGEKLCKALFYHCDISLLKYGYYRESKTLLDNFRIRLRYLVKSDLEPSLLICVSMALCMVAVGRPWKIISLLPMFMTVLLLTVFFDIYQLFLYYVFQPYLEDYATKGMGYTICSTLMYWLCWGTLQIKVGSIWFTLAVAAITIICIPLSYVLIYKLAPKRFKLH